MYTYRIDTRTEPHVRRREVETLAEAKDLLTRGKQDPDAFFVAVYRRGDHGQHLPVVRFERALTADAPWLEMSNTKAVS